jgi:hypothetical protein
MAQHNTAPTAHDHPAHGETVTVTLVVDDTEGGTQTLEITLASGPTKVPDLKVALGVPAEASLWLVRRNDKPKQLVDHATHNVKAGDRFETIVKGGVS